LHAHSRLSPPLLFLPFLSLTTPRPPRSPLSPYTTLFRSGVHPPPACRGDLLRRGAGERDVGGVAGGGPGGQDRSVLPRLRHRVRSEEHTSELQSRFDLVCRLLLEKNKHTPETEVDLLYDD